MTRSRQPALLLVLVGVMIAVYARAWWRAATPPKGVRVAGSGEEPRALTPPAEPAVPERAALREAQRRRTALLAWERDPFIGGASRGDASGLNLSGILWDASRPIAIINGRMIQAGEEIKGYVVVEITHDHVSLTGGTHTVQLSLAP